MVTGAAALAFLLLGAVSSQEVSLIPDNSDVGLSVQFVLTNNQQEPLNFVVWNTPLEGIFADFFDVVSSSGRRAEYVGMLVKRAATPDLSEFISLPTGQSVSAHVDLSLHYELWNDTWSVSLRTQLGMAASAPAPLTGQALPAIKFLPLTTEPIASTVSAVLPRPQPPTPTKLGDYISCSASQSNLVDDAVVNAHAISKNALTYAQSTCDPAYITWFGQHVDTLLRPEVVNHFTKISEQIESAFFSINCQPPQCSSPSVFAYVYPTDATYTIYLCGQFWKASSSVTYDSQSGTLVHEFSHFRTIAGTQDYVYGTPGAMQLARTDPGKAVFNADNHEYFAEVQPHCQQ